MKKLFAFIAIAITLVGCSSSDGGNNNTANYDKTAMLTNWADNLIIPAYTAYDTATGTLKTSTDTFTANPNATNLEALQAAWLDAFKAYQHVALFDIGKATDLNLLESANTYPTDAAGIESNITSGSYNLELQAQFVRQGFPALDYLLFGLGDTNDETLAFYTTNANAVAYKQYLTAVATRLKTTSAAIVADWNGGYRDTFVNNSNVVTGSLNQSANNFVKNLEKDIRAPKVGIPAGLFSNGVLYPEKVEAYYNDNAGKALLNEAIAASKNFFNGTSFDGSASGASLKGYLDAVGAKVSGQNLSDIINAQYTTVNTTNAALSNSLSQQVTNDNTKMVASYDQMQQLLVYLKVDMFSALSLTIDYVDGDGD
ncbi:imelysin family protein [Flavobacterium sp. RHBU_3]|uniref:imelysin family protein n=1 Tax=Flavobacterium sp. RHBU_3 TaxID=3391184 RepID=UPI0039848DEB